jgi:phosphatidylglycerophosphatase A
MKTIIWKLIGTTFYTGYLPLAPGTFASLLVLGIVPLLYRRWNLYGVILVWVFILGILSANYLTQYWHKKDDQRINIDEFFGMLLGFFLVPRITVLILIVGFFLFRFFDILKPLAIRSAEKIRGGVGVMFDDLLAGLYTNLLLQIIVRLMKS